MRRGVAGEPPSRRAAVILTLALVPVAVSAEQFGATYLVFEKTTKMKKVAASLYLPFPDPSVRGARLDDRRRVRCAAVARGKSGTVATAGRLVLRLVGEESGSAARWTSRALQRTLDERGEARFEDDEILQLVDEAAAPGVDLELLEIEFDGGKGAKIAQLTVDCVHEDAQ